MLERTPTIASVEARNCPKAALNARNSPRERDVVVERPAIAKIASEARMP
jgi:hypothetical protein